MKFFNRYLLLIFVTFYCISCVSWTNPTPDYINPEYASFDNGKQNSGILCITLQLSDDILNEISGDELDLLQQYISSYGQGFIVSDNFVTRYNMLIKDNNKKTDKQTEKIVENFGVYCIIENKFYYITKQGVSQFLILNDKYKLQYTIQK